jgi:glucose/arabinose dehydrogenase
MKRLLIAMSLPALACAGLAGPVSTTSTPAPATEPVTGTAPSAPLPSEATVQAMEAPSTRPANASAFPNVNGYEWRLTASGLFRPVDIQAAYDGSQRLFILEKSGYIRVHQNGELLAAPFLDISDRVDDSSNEMGLLGLAFHPDFEQNGYFYVNYTGAGGHTSISRFQAGAGSTDPNTEKVLMTIRQPFPNHNGGALAFGPDGYLYLALGDGGAAGDPLKNGQNTASLLGKILRIDVNIGDPYAIPAGNPFGNEVWAYGLRNPWRISFDRANGDLWIGDVGQGAWEEIDTLPAGAQGGANFGWSIMEGNHGYDGDPAPGLLLPAVEYSHEFGCSVTGGYVYRGRMPEWNGIYLYGDYCTGYIWGLLLSAGGWQNQLLYQTGSNITTFGVDEAGELYFAGDNGNVYQLAKK